MIESFIPDFRNLTLIKDNLADELAVILNSAKRE
jgi:hypothetical protein